MALLDKIYVSGSWVNSNARFTNVGGTPIVSVAESGSGEAIADEYTITFSAVGGGTGTGTIGTSSPNNPYKGRVVTGIALDGATVVTNVIPGLGIVFNAATANGNSATIFAGAFLGVFESFGAGADVPSDGIRHQVTNNGAADVSAAVATLLPMAISYRKTGIVFNYIKTFAEGATEKIAGGGSTKTLPYALKAIAISGSGPSKIATLQVDGVTLGADSLLDITTGLSVSGTGIKATSTPYPYRVLTGPLTGLEFAISASVATNDIENVLIFPSRFVQIAPDVAGSEGTYGIVDVDLTQSGQSTGVILTTGVAYYWVRVRVPVGGAAESNPYPLDICLKAVESVSAGWGD